jgi:hypothetical protein
MTTGLLLTTSFSERDIAHESDPAMIFAVGHERVLRELRFRVRLEQDDALDAVELSYATLSQVVFARDAGDVCHVCGGVVTWTEHLPPRDPGGAVRCFVNVRTLLPASVAVDDIFPRV